MKINLGELTKYLNAQVLTGDIQKESNGAVIDTRKITGGEVFYAFLGEKNNGHDYIETAAKAGALAAVVEKNIKCSLENFTVLKVDNSKAALQQSSRLARDKFKGKVIAITGSNGKTTTKDMIAAVLSQSFKTHKTFANLNNELGLPLTILNCPDNKEVLVLEMGMRASGEIAFLADIAKPHIGIVTNIGISHMELLKSQENIAQAKFELISALKEDGIAILNADDEWCMKLAPENIKVVKYGFSDTAHICCIDTQVTTQGTTFKVSIKNIVYNAFLPTWGRHNIANALAAIATGISLGMSPEDTINGLKTYSPSPMRLEIKTGKFGFCILDDAYNSNPISAMASIEVTRSITDGRTIAVLGEMYELGELEEQGHLEVGYKVATSGIDYLVTVGKKAAIIAKGAVKRGMDSKKVFIFPDNDKAIIFLLGFLHSQDTLLVKGSRGMHMETIVSALT